MKKVLLTSMILLSAVSFGGNIYAQETAGGNDTEVTTPSESSASVEFNASEDGKTLAISGHGDLTSYMTTERSARVFTDEAVGFVFTGANAGTSVSANESYNVANTYYRADYTYNLLCQGVPNNYNFKEVKSTSTWKETADLSKLYAISYVNTKNGSHIIGMAKKVTSANTPDLASNWSYGDLANQAYYIISDENIADQQLDIETLEEKGCKTISLVEFSKEYVDVSATYSVLNSGVVFVKHANSESYESLLADKTYDYVDGDEFYTATASFVKIDNNATFFAENAEYLKEDPKQITVAQLALSKIRQGAYENVVFKNESATEPTEPLVIDKSIIRAIMYPDFIASQTQTANANLRNLDLGEATVKDYSGRDFLPTDETGNDYIANQHLKMNTFTLPLTSVNEDGNMILPTNALGGLTGNLSLTNVKIPDGYTQIASDAFYQASHLKSVELGKDVIEIGEKAFFSCNSLQNIKFDENLKTIGKFAFGGTDLRSLSLPKNLDKVCDGAFWNLKQLYVIELNENLRYIGNGAFGCDGDLGDKCKTQTTIKIPASVKYIGAYAFSERKYQDVYFLGKVAPVCPEGTFEDGQNTRHEGTAFTSTDDKVHFGNSGFSTSEKNSPLADDVSQGYANRENYINGGFYFTILHYPSDATDVDTYTDTTRKYLCRVQEDGNINTEQTTVGQETLGDIDYWDAQNVQTTVDPGYADTYVGTQYVWPSHSQFTRAYATAAKGVKWDGVTPYAPDLSGDALAVLKEAGYDMTDVNLAQKAYIGTRKFAIANGDGKSLPSYNFEVTKGEWWTICVPFNMTKKQVLDAFGADTKLCLFTSVVRQIDINNKNHILLNFTQSALKSSTTDGKGKKLQKTPGHWDYDAIASSEEPEDNDIVLWAHESYMIKPDGGAYSDKEPTYIMDSYEQVEGNPLPTIVNATTETLGQADDFTAEYRFIGNYLGNAETRAASVKIPQYSYVYATTKSDPVCKFRFYTGTTSIWKPNKSIVQTNNRGGGAADYKNFFGGEPGILPAGAKQSSIFGDEDFGTVTGIDDVTIVVGSEALTPIFNLEGKMVRANGNVEGLPKGVYVKAGKKFIVK